RCQTGVVPQQPCEEGLGAGGWQRVEAYVRVVSLAAPAVLVLGAIIDQQTAERCRQAFDEPVAERLRLTVNPVQVLKDQEQWLHLAFPQQHAPQGLQGALATLRRIELTEWALVGQHIKEREERWQRVLERLVQGEHLARDLGAHG